MIAFNKTLGKFQLVGIPPAPRGMPMIEVAFDIDANGIINVSAKDLGTGNQQQIRIEGGSGLKEEEVQQMIRDAEAHADEAHRLRELAEVRAKTEALQEASHKLAEAVYATASAQQQTAATGGNGAPSDDEVVEEGDYEVIDEEEGAT